MKTLLFCISLGLLIVVSALAADASGKWQFKVEFDNGGQTGEPVFELKQVGAKLSGTYDGPLGKHPVTGSVSGQTVTISLKGKRDSGDEFELVYVGKFDGSTKMSGRLTFNGNDGAKWTALKQ